MPTKLIKVDNVAIGGDGPLAVIAGPCVIESKESALRHAAALKERADRVGVPYIFKSSYDKANRSSVNSFRGLGLDKGLAILAEVKQKIGVPILTDVHEIDQVAAVKEVADILQIPAFLCRQTDFVVAVAQVRQCRQRQEGPVPRALGYAQRHRQNSLPPATSKFSSPSAARRSDTII